MGTTRKASVKETGEELSPETWKRFEDAADHVHNEAPADKLRDQAKAVREVTPEKTVSHD